MIANYIKIMRPLNCLFIGLAVLAGALLNQVSAVEIYSLEIILVFISATLIGAGGYVVNDYFDMHIDAVNKPRRVLPSGAIRPAEAYTFSLFLFGIGICLGVLTANVYVIVLAVVNSLLLYYYAKRIKKMLLVSNVLVGWTTASTFIYGALITNNLDAVYPIFLYTLLYTITREIIKDAEDAGGDRKFGVKTLATALGERGAVISSLLPAIIVAVLLILAYRAGILPVSLFYAIFISYVIPLSFIYIFLFNTLQNKSAQMKAAHSQNNQEEEKTPSVEVKTGRKHPSKGEDLDHKPRSNFHSGIKREKLKIAGGLCKIHMLILLIVYVMAYN